MTMSGNVGPNRILVIDDNPAIHEDFRKIFSPISALETAVSKTEAELFGEEIESSARPTFEIDSVFQGAEAVDAVRRALDEGRPYAMVFVDVRMPPGWDGVETTLRIWQAAPETQVVLCTAYSDYSWEQIRSKLGRTDRLVILKKPFDNIEVLQLADALTHKWQLSQHSKSRFADLEQSIAQRTRELQASNAQLSAAQRQLAQSGVADAAMTTQAVKRLVLQEKLKHALEADELSMNYQPLVDIQTRRIVSLEALVRWHHPRDGFISPAEFIPMAEESGLILPLGEFVLRTVCEQIKRWEREGVPVVPVSVNLSTVQLQSQNIVELVSRMLESTGVKPNQLVLEITESALMKDAINKVADLQKLRDSGVGVEIDDFGTGYSSLSYLKHLPIDTLKIDRSFINHIDTNTADETIVSAVLAMAHSLGLKVTAEGVETAAQLEVLRRHGCETAQGYHFSKPLSASACAQLLLDVGERPSFTETLRIRLTNGSRPAGSAVGVKR
jgi:EAL domain-containing protein (putative c-di-GMP-specific phosphodiesterase class I)